jgi:putative membrane protein
MGFLKNYLRLYLISFLALWLLGRFMLGVEFVGGYQTVALTSLVLTILGALVKPLIKILLLPINLITLGAFRWLINVITLWLVTLIVSQFKIASFVFPGLEWNGFIVPSFFVAKFWAFVLASLFISLITSFILWLTK